MSHNDVSRCGFFFAPRERCFSTQMRRFLNRNRNVILAFACVALLHIEFFVGQAMWMWSREHYQYFPLVLFAFAAIVRVRLKNVTWNNSPILSIRTAMLGVMALVLYWLALVLHSNWLGSLSGLLSVWTVVRSFGGPDMAGRLKGPALFVLMAIPIPLNYDLRLIIWLQKIATSVASGLLDLASVLHTTSGVAIRTVERSFLVEEACSGIHSLFSCLAVMIFISVIRNEGLIRLVVNATQTVLWVLVANALRVFLVILAFSKWRVHLEEGWPHELLGVATYAFALGLSLSTERLLAFLVPSSRVPFGFSGEFGGDRTPLSGLAVSITRVSNDIRQFLDRGLLSPRASTGIVFALLILTPLLLQSQRFVKTQIQRPATISDTPQSEFRLSDRITENLLPETIGGWKLVNTERIQRNSNDPLGSDSTTFTYKGNGLTAVFSIDGHYPAWHDLAYCYTAVNWKLKRQQNIKDDASSTWFTELLLYDDQEQYSVCYFSCFDSQNDSVAPDDPTIGVIPTLSLLLSRLPGQGSGDNGIQPVIPPVFQFQLLCSSSHELLEFERRDLKELFLHLSETAIASIRKGQE